MCCSTVSANDLEKKNNGHLLTLLIWPSCVYHVWGAMHVAFWKASAEAKYSFWIKSHTGKKKHGKIFRRTKLSRVSERGWESTWSLEEEKTGKKIFREILFLARPVDSDTHYNTISIEEIDYGDEAAIGLFLLLKNYLLLASVVALYSSWSYMYKTQLLSETVCEAWVLFLQWSTDYIIHCRRRRGHSVQKHPQKRSTCIAASSGRATSTALQPQKPTWNQQDSERENCGPQWQRFFSSQFALSQLLNPQLIYIGLITALLLLFKCYFTTF